MLVLVLVLNHSRVAGTADPEDLSTGYKSLRLLGTALVGAFWWICHRAI